jgi:hypothetical protein
MGFAFKLEVSFACHWELLQSEALESGWKLPLGAR